ncbi:hypothetical protein [Micromonospora ureilytica]|uniref:Bacteriophage tail tape measure N-terminal domain-containing protein n=1 Tax=Micromonospora ureilytica TaxID=709868 RepID=A0ABS0JSP0_9ACTN|nr:hypothetical protein [Micromonospora ureilytica]MBG6070062.1 hypothetical protein [Micromonospora ureilytica]
MARTVKVELLLEAARYIRGGRQAKRATDDVKDSVEDLGGASEKASQEAEQLGDELSEMARDARRLDAQIDETRDGIRELARQIAATSDEASRADLSKKLKVDQAGLRRNLNLRKLMEVEAEDAASGFAARFGGRIGPLMASAPIASGAGAAGAALGLAMAPTLSAALSGAVVGGAAGAGIVGGVILAARDARVQAAGKDLGGFILGDLEKRAAGFTPVVLDSIDDIRAGWGALGPDLSRIFNSSRLVEPLVAGLVSGGQKLVGGIADAVDNADAPVAAFGTLLDGVGDAAGDAFTTLSQDADEGASAIEDLTTAVTSFIRVSAAIVHAGATVKGWTDQVDTAIDRGRYWIEDSSYISEALARQGIQLDITADGFKAGTAEAEAYRAATEGTATAADFATLKAAGMTDAQVAAADASGTFRAKTEEVNGALGANGESYRNTTQSIEEFNAKLAEAFELQNKGTSANLSAEQANLRLEEAIDKATAAGKANNDGISTNTERGRANREALLGIAGAAATAAEKVFEQTRSQDAATVATERGRAKFLQAAAAMGVERGEAKRLADQLFGIPPERNTKAEFTPDNKGVKAWKKTLSGIDKTIFTSARLLAIVDIEVRREQATEATGRRWGGVTEHARWGTAVDHAQWGVLREAHVASPVAGARYAYAEQATGGEAFVPKYGDPRRSLDILATAAGWYGATVQSRPQVGSGRAVPAAGGGGTQVYSPTFNVNVSVAPGANLADVGRVTVQAIRAYERGGGKTWRKAG